MASKTKKGSRPDLGDPDNPPVLVVGAGPVGLSAAAFLAHYGTPVHIIDPNAAATPLSKALIVWRRTIHCLDPVLHHEELLKRGAPIGRMRIGDSGRMFASIAFNDLTEGPADPATGAGLARGLPPGILLTQAAMEEALETTLRDRYSIRVDRGTRLLSFRPDSERPGVVATLSDASGRTRDVAAPFLIAADGAHSAVRHALNIPFKGVTAPMKWEFIDVKYEKAPGINKNRARDASDRVFEEDGGMIMTTAAGTVGIIAVARRPGVMRLTWEATGRKAAGDAKSGSPPPPPTLEEWQDLLMKHTLLDVQLKEITWAGQFGVNERQAESYVNLDGRVLLAGDAAHVHSPAGGQGMNLGIQDAVNLAWKVAMAEAGEAAAQSALLASYHQERWPLGHKVIKTTNKLVRFNTTRDPLLRALRRAAIGSALSLRSARRGAALTITQDSMEYKKSPLTAPKAPAPARRPPARGATPQEREAWGRCRPGTAFPDAHVWIAGAARPATDLLRGPPGTFGTLVLLMPRTGRAGAAAGVGPSADAAAWPAAWGPRPLRVLRVALRPDGNVASESDTAPDAAKRDMDADAEDTWGLLAAAFGVSRRRARRRAGTLGVVVRPDGYVAAIGGPEAIGGWLAQHVVAPQ